MDMLCCCVQVQKLDQFGKPMMEERPAAKSKTKGGWCEGGC